MKPIFASARDIGNIAAGVVAGRSGLGWGAARLGLDGLESYENGRFTRESTTASILHLPIILHILTS
jgi:hypothetical protein